MIACLVLALLLLQSCVIASRKSFVFAQGSTYSTEQALLELETLMCSLQTIYASTEVAYIHLYENEIDLVQAELDDVAWCANVASTDMASILASLSEIEVSSEITTALTNAQNKLLLFNDLVMETIILVDENDLELAEHVIEELMWQLENCMDHLHLGINLLSGNLYGTLDIYVIGPEGEPLEGVTIQTEGPEMTNEISDTNGVAVFNDIRIGYYNLTASANGYSTAKRTIILYETQTMWILLSPLKPCFSPMENGFSFNNTEFTGKMKRPIQEIREQFSSFALANEIPQYQWAIFEYLLQAVEWTQQGYCGGMVKTAQLYYETPSSLPSGYSQTYDIPITETSTHTLITINQWNQFIDGQGLFKWLLLRLGDEPTGLVPSKEEIDWILEQLDQRTTVRLTVFDPSLEWMLSHAVLAYDYEESGNDIYLKVYGPNLGNVQNGLFEDTEGNMFETDSQGGQTIHLVRNADGSYMLDSGVVYVDGLKVTKLGSQEAPTWGLSVATLVPYMPEIVFNVMNYLVDETFIMFMAESPVDLLVTSPISFSVGYDSETQTVVNEIEGAMYSGPRTEPQLIVIPNPMQGNYSIETFGTGDGDFTITVESVVPSLPDVNVTSWTGTTSEGTLDTFGIELTADFLVIPEFPSCITLLLFMIVTLVVIMYKKRPV